MGALFFLTGCMDSNNNAEITTESISTEYTETEESTVEITEQITEADDEKKELDEFLQAKLMHKYADLIARGDCGRLYEDWTEYMENSEKPSRYAIYDVDSDGRLELIISYTETAMAGMFETIYEYNPQTEVLTEELRLFPALTYYDNGVIKAEWSHNQGMGNSLWPFDLFSYDNASDSYIQRGSVDTWEKAAWPEDYEGNPFPDDLDTDGDGIIYYLSDEDDDLYNNPQNKAEYDSWYQSVVGDAKELEIPWKPLDTSEAVIYTKNYISLLIKRRKEKLAEDEFDIGLFYMENEGNYEAVNEELENSYGFTITELNEFYKQGEISGKTIYQSFDEDGGSIEYYGEKWDGMTLFGIYPGMEEGEAKALLAEAGFYLSENRGYITGENSGNFGIYLETENGIVNKIGMHNYCAFAG